ncbi:MAG TPA: BNR repeat-containing protein [Cyclobacteriaceae bacterium]|nr:BNR repeat-containing protein [Cyclobacteriaceae bacterium]
MIPRRALLLCCHSLLLTLSAHAQFQMDTLGLGWSKTSVNAVIFRKNSVTSFKDTSYVSYYDTTGRVVIAFKRGKEQPWSSARTSFKGNVADAHNSISMITDGEGYLHLAWDHHNNKLNYARSNGHGSIEMRPGRMTGKNEEHVTYPEFHRMPNGDLIFLYRDGESGRGNLVMNRYDIKEHRWLRVQDNLIDGENERNAYWQAFVSQDGTIHISWVWREEPDVATNHDMCYARSRDGGVTWEKANGEKYTLPVRAGNAEYARMIPQQSELINQTSMSTTADGHPVIATYWRTADSTVPQFFIIWYDGKSWKHEQVSRRTQPFSLKGGGTKKIPISRPQVVVSGRVKKMKVRVIYRDNERGHLVTVATRSAKGWTYEDMIPCDDSAWEPSYDHELFRSTGELRLFVQDVGQGDGEKLSDKKPTPVVIMTVK